MVSRGSSLIRQNLPEARKAYTQGGILGVADYLVTLPDFFREPPVITFGKVTVVPNSDPPTVNASMSEALPLRGPPFTLSLEGVLPAVLSQVLEKGVITYPNGEQEEVLVVNDQKRVLLSATAVA